MRAHVALALLALLLPLAASACDSGSDVPDGAAPWAHKVYKDEVTDVVDGIGVNDALALAKVGGPPESIVRTPHGATLLAWSVAGLEGERTASAWIAFAPDGHVTGSLSADVFLRASPAAYDGGFLVAGSDSGDYTTPLLVSEAGKITTPAPALAEPRPARAGDVILGGHGGAAFRPSDGTFAPLPVAEEDPLGGMMPTALDGSGALTVISGSVRKPALLHSPDGGTTWERKAIELPGGLTIVAERLLTDDRRTLLPLVDAEQRAAGWITRAAGDKTWTVTSFEPAFGDSWILGLVGERVLIGPFDDTGGTLVSLDDTEDRTEIKRDALRASGGKLYSMSPKVTESADGKTWTDVPLEFPED